MATSATEKLLNKMLRQIRPDQESVLKTVNLFLKKLGKALKDAELDAKALVGGSIAKNTNLAGDHDCDVFIRFNYDKYKKKDISKLLKLALKPLKPELVHGSRDYFQINNKINFEIVPVLDITDPKKALNVTDMSPLHVDWVKKNKKVADQIRLAKQFCKSVGVYGAESYIKGFSGHVLDILTIHYGGFIKLLQASKHWQSKEVIDPEDYFKGNALKKLNRSKMDSAIIVIDPVLPDRNAAAALSEEKLDRFKKAAIEFLKQPEEKFFKIVPVTEKLIKEQHKKNIILLKATPMKGKTDIVGAKLLKAFTAIKNKINFHDFKVKDSDWYWNKKDDALFWFVYDKATLLPLTKHVGPPITARNNVKMFKEKHEKTFTEKGRICTYVPRNYTKIVDLIDHVLSEKVFFKDKVKKIDWVNQDQVKTLRKDIKTRTAKGD